MSLRPAARRRRPPRTLWAAPILLSGKEMRPIRSLPARNLRSAEGEVDWQPHPTRNALAEVITAARSGDAPQAGAGGQRFRRQLHMRFRTAQRLGLRLASCTADG